MPRKSRIDAAGALHHVMVRGIEKGVVFRDDKDRAHFLERLGGILLDAKTLCYAWVLIPNHFHLLLRTGPVPISTLMRRLLTGYALWYNRRHHRNAWGSLDIHCLPGIADAGREAGRGVGGGQISADCGSPESFVSLGGERTRGPHVFVGTKAANIDPGGE